MRFRVGGMLLLAACYHPSPVVGLPCSPSGECPPEQVCDLAAAPPTCVSIFGDAGVDPDVPDDAPLGCVLPSDCPVATESICDPLSHVCRGCVADAECSGACSEYDGQCVPGGQVIFVSGSGIDGGNCNASAPCRSLAFALSQLTANRRMISVGDGTYAAPNGNVTLSISNTGGRIVVSGTDLAPGGAELTATSSSTSNPVVVQTGNATDVVIEGLTIRNGPNDGVRNDGTLRLSHLVIRTNNGRGLQSNPANQAPVHVWDCRIADNNNEGINAQNGPFELLRSVVLRNANGGVQLQRSAATIVGSIIARNGDSGSGYGGLLLRNFDLLPQTIAFLTIANNAASGGNISGLAADSVVALSSSILTDNTNATAGPPQLGAEVTATYSLFSGTAPAGAGNLGAVPGFVDAAMDDYHLVPASPARDVADPAAPVGFDLDGEPRPLGNGFDIGADEVP